MYKLTRKHANAAEILFAEFFDINDAKMFIDTIQANETNEVKVFYRILTANELPANIENPFNVIIRNTENCETTLAKFCNIKDAKAFIDLKLLADADSNNDETYYLLDVDKFIQKFNQATIAAKQEKQAKHMIRPSPLIKRLRPRGSAFGMYNTDENNDEDKT